MEDLASVFRDFESHLAPGSLGWLQRLRGAAEIDHENLLVVDMPVLTPNATNPSRRSPVVYAPQPLPFYSQHLEPLLELAEPAVRILQTTERRKSVAELITEWSVSTY